MGIPISKKGLKKMNKNTQDALRANLRADYLTPIMDQMGESELTYQAYIKVLREQVQATKALVAKLLTYTPDGKLDIAMSESRQSAISVLLALNTELIEVQNAKVKRYSNAA